jgi:hypothetical protein
LDVAAEAVTARLDAWLRDGLTVASLTWMDLEAAWPRPLLLERSEVRRPMSLQLRVRDGGGSEAEFTLYAGGWVDVWVALSAMGEPSPEYVELETADEFGPLLDRVLAPLIAPS